MCTGKLYFVYFFKDIILFLEGFKDFCEVTFPRFFYQEFWLMDKVDGRYNIHCPTTLSPRHSPS